MSIRLDNHQLRAALAHHLASQPLLPEWRVELVKDGVAADVTVVDRRSWAALPWSDDEPASPVLNGLDDLTSREREVLHLVANGYANREIAEGLHVTCATVKTHMRSILRKTSCASRAQLIALIHTAGAQG